MSEYLVISRGQWDPAASKQDVQRAIDAAEKAVAGAVNNETPAAWRA